MPGNAPSPDLQRRAWEALVRELGRDDAMRFWRESGLDGAPWEPGAAPEASSTAAEPSRPTPPTPPVTAPPAPTPYTRRPTPNTLWENPVLTLAFRRQMRHVATFWILLGYVLVLATVLLVIQTAFIQQNPGRSPELLGPQIGRAYWLASTLIQTMALGLVAMVLGASAFALEREQRTSEALRLTRLTPAAVLLGKGIASYAALALLVLSAVPLLAVTFLFGGVAPAEVARSTALILASAAGFLGIGILCSARSRRAITAMVHATLVTGLLLFGIPVIGIFRGVVFGLPFGPGWALFRPMILLNPLLATLNLFEPNRPLTPSVSEQCILFYLTLALVCCLAAWARLVREARNH